MPYENPMRRQPWQKVKVTCDLLRKTRRRCLRSPRNHHLMKKTSWNSISTLSLSRSPTSKSSKTTTSLDKFYKVIEPHLNEEEPSVLKRIQNILINSIDIMVEEIEPSKMELYLKERINYHHQRKRDDRRRCSENKNPLLCETGFSQLWKNRPTDARPKYRRYLLRRFSHPYFFISPQLWLPEKQCPIHR